MTKIEWTDKTWNPLVGCSKVSEGCKNCYAEKMAYRLAHNPMTKQLYGQVVHDELSMWNGQIALNETALMQPLRTKKPTRYFVNSMSDLFHENVPDEWIERIFEVMIQEKRHIFQILTKRPQRMFESVNAIASQWGNYDDASKNIWLGVSVENQQAADERIPLLLQTPAAVRFLSCEPLLGLVDLTDILHGADHISFPESDDVSQSRTVLNHNPGPNIDWVIAGGESGPGARPMHPDWVRSLRDQCQVARVPFFFKQWGEYIHTDECDDELRRKYNTNEPMAEFAKVGKKKAGRLLYGRTWDEFPEVAR